MFNWNACTASWPNQILSHRPNPLMQVKRRMSRLPIQRSWTPLVGTRRWALFGLGVLQEED